MSHTGGLGASPPCGRPGPREPSPAGRQVSCVSRPSGLWSLARNSADPRRECQPRLPSRQERASITPAHPGRAEPSAPGTTRAQAQTSSASVNAQASETGKAALRMEQWEWLAAAHSKMWICKRLRFKSLSWQALRPAPEPPASGRDAATVGRLLRRGGYPDRTSSRACSRSSGTPILGPIRVRAGSEGCE